MRRRINKQHMVNGVTFIDPATTYIDAGIEIGSDTIIEPGVQIQGNTVIGSDCIIGAHSKIVDSTIEDKVEIKSSVIEEAIVRKMRTLVHTHTCVQKQILVKMLISGIT